MKDSTTVIDLNNLPENNEKSTIYDINVSEFDATSTYLELEEDLDEKLITYIEREIRTSYEYRKYINYLKNELDLTRCSLLEGLDCNIDKMTLEFHHYPINLYEITEAVARQRVLTLGEDEKVSCFEIAEQVMKEHFRGNIGVVPLSKTMHEMAHNRSIIVPINKVEGNYKKFLKKYSSYIGDDIKDRISMAEIESISDDSKLFNKSKLEKNISEFNINYINKGGYDG